MKYIYPLIQLVTFPIYNGKRRKLNKVETIVLQLATSEAEALKIARARHRKLRSPLSESKVQFRAHNVNSIKGE